MKQVKDGDCFICAYAESEGIPWRVAKRRLRKVRGGKKEMFVMSLQVKLKGLRGYSMVEGSFNSLHEAFDFGEGVLIFSWGDGGGHAVYWDGCKIIDHVDSGRFNGEQCVRKLRRGESVHMILRKDERKLTIIIKSKALLFMMNAKDIYEKVKPWTQPN